MKKDTNLLNGKGEDEDVYWITVNGAHIPVEEGESKKDAITKHFKDKAEQKSFIEQGIKQLLEWQNEKPTLAKQVDKVLQNPHNGSHVILSPETPKVLQDLGLPNKPLLITNKHTYLAINASGVYKGKDDNYHDLGKETFLMIPKLLEHPVLVLQQDSENILVVLNRLDKNGDRIICPIKINGIGLYNEISIDSNIVKSVYGKKDLQSYIRRNFTRNDVLYGNNKKIRDLHH